MAESYDKINQKYVEVIKTSKDEYEINQAIQALYDNNVGLIMNKVNMFSIADRKDALEQAYYCIWESAKNYKAKKGTVFSTYFTTCFENKLLALSAQSTELSQYTKNKIKKLSKYIKEYTNLNKKEPTIDEMAEYMGCKNKTIESYLFLRQLQSVKSLDDDDTREVADESSIEKEIIREYESKRIKEILNRLTDKEKDILERKYGLNGRKVEDFKSIAKTYNQSDENIRIIHNNTLIKLRKMLTGGVKNEK